VFLPLVFFVVEKNATKNTRGRNTKTTMNNKRFYKKFLQPFYPFLNSSLIKTIINNSFEIG